MCCMQARRLHAKNQDASRVLNKDMFLAGVLGMLEAARRWSPQAATGAFLTYAHHYIVKAMVSTFQDYENNDIFIPRYLHDVRPRVLRAAKELHAQSGQPEGQQVGGTSARHGTLARASQRSTSPLCPLR